MPLSVAVILGVVAALVATVAAFVLIIPEKKRAQLGNKILVWLHDFFNFKSLWIEKILKFLFVFETLVCVGVGFFMLFSVEGFYLGGIGLLLIILGPIANRIIYEFIMLAILAVKNLMEINSKLAPQKGSPAEKASQSDDQPQF